MEVVHRRCAGVEVHKKNVVVCLIRPDGSGGFGKEIRKFGTMTEDLLVLSDWLRAEEVKVVAMESTGVYWKPVFNILESECEVMVVNAEHIKHVPGRKTDINDAQWIAELLQHGLLKGSYIPEVQQRDLRDLIRYRTSLVQDRVRDINRVQKVLEDANIKLGSVASEVLGVSGREMIEAMIRGVDDPQVLAQFARRKLRDKIAELERAMSGRVRAKQRLMLRLHLEHIDDLTSKIDTLSQEIDRLLVPFDQNDELRRLDGIPGVGKDVAQIIIAELGIDMTRFPSAAHAASWAGLSPGKNESAGRNRSGKIRPGNKHLKPPSFKQLMRSAIPVTTISPLNSVVLRRDAASSGRLSRSPTPSLSLPIICCGMEPSIVS
jgi:transposase